MCLRLFSGRLEPRTGCALSVVTTSATDCLVSRAHCLKPTFKVHLYAKDFQHSKHNSSFTRIPLVNSGGIVLQRTLISLFFCRKACRLLAIALAVNTRNTLPFYHSFLQRLKHLAVSLDRYLQRIHGCLRYPTQVVNCHREVLQNLKHYISQQALCKAMFKHSPAYLSVGPSWAV